ncbi:hypothetical protein BJY01DRAFT_188919 [Aspergillus pseudoustus]|uniref:C2H2-type domain-containing protein n=1 Tax=Aspergillus pseudoustus TaxID=1810923 RepID=A0ABR4JWF7_9EURO
MNTPFSKAIPHGRPLHSIKRTISEDCTGSTNNDRQLKYLCLAKEARRHSQLHLDHFTKVRSIQPRRRTLSGSRGDPKSIEGLLANSPSPGTELSEYRHLTNYPSPKRDVSPAPPATFECHHPRCPAAPFQSQYLLNSHSNVHLQDRPHFCQIEGCSRGPAGKGFKRKKDMIRHMRVHNYP